MTDQHCAATRERIPDLVSHRLPPDEAAALESHVGQCSECAAELEFVRTIYASRAKAPEGLADRVIAGLGTRSNRGVDRPWWALSAAAVAALALGIGIVSDRTGPAADLEVPGYAYEMEEGELWLSDDGLVAGAPSLDALSDEALEVLLDELSVGGGGGSA
jgi:hypothetical protein